ncbi:MAG TPA: CsbD family protein [Longimicrobiales bacterium]|nr:CsbD family protein [Longimicrobiales bacterium]
MADDRRVDDERTISEKGAENNLRGKGNELKGRVKDAVGGLTNDSSLQAEGKFDKVKGKVQDKVGDVQRRIGRETDEPRR